MNPSLQQPPGIGLSGVGVVQCQRPRWEDGIIKRHEKRGRGGGGQCTRQGPQTTISQKAAAIAGETAVMAAVAAAAEDDDMGGNNVGNDDMGSMADNGRIDGGRKQCG